MPSWTTENLHPNSLLDTLIPPDSKVEIDAKIVSGYLSSGKQVTNIWVRLSCKMIWKWNVNSSFFNLIHQQLPTPLIPFTVCDILSLVTLYLVFMPKCTSQSINIHRHPAIYIYPYEILDKIFLTVCMDSGATGRTSSTVSKATVRVNVFNIARLSKWVS